MSAAQRREVPPASRYRVRVHSGAGCGDRSVARGGKREKPSCSCRVAIAGGVPNRCASSSRRGSIGALPTRGIGTSRSVSRSPPIPARPDALVGLHAPSRRGRQRPAGVRRHCRHLPRLRIGSRTPDPVPAAAMERVATWFHAVDCREVLYPSSGYRPSVPKLPARREAIASLGRGSSTLPAPPPTRFCQLR
jgi:hypothetical protein